MGCRLHLVFQGLRLDELFGRLNLFGHGWDGLWLTEIALRLLGIILPIEGPGESSTAIRSIGIGVPYPSGSEWCGLHLYSLIL